MKHIVLKPNERIQRIVHGHAVLFWRSWFVSIMCLGGASFFMFYLLAQPQWGVWLFSFIVAVGLYAFFRAMIFWRGTKAVITTHRLVDIEKSRFFGHDMSEIMYQDVVNLHLKRKGIGATVFRYGDVIVEMGDEDFEVVLTNVRKPHVVMQMIDELREQHLTREVDIDVVEVVKDKVDELPVKELKRIRKIVHEKIKELEAKKTPNI